MVEIIKTYKQTRPMSCGPSCALMVAEHFSPGLIPFTQTEEHAIHDSVKSADLGNYTMPSAIVKFLISKGFNVKYELSQKQGHNPMVDACLNRDEQFRPSLGSAFQRRDFSMRDIKQELKRKRFVMVPLNLGDEHTLILHWVVLIGVQGWIRDMYVYADPHDGAIKRMSSRKLQKKMNILFVKLFVSVWKNSK